MQDQSKMECIWHFPVFSNAQLVKGPVLKEAIGYGGFAKPGNCALNFLGAKWQKEWLTSFSTGWLIIAGIILFNTHSTETEHIMKAGYNVYAWGRVNVNHATKLWVLAQFTLHMWISGAQLNYHFRDQRSTLENQYTAKNLYAYSINFDLSIY